MKTNKHIFYLVIGFLVLATSCFTVSNSSPTKRPNTSSIYNPFIYRLHPQYFVYHENSGKSRLYTKIYLSELMFAPIGPNKSYQGKVNVSYKIYPADKLTNFVDSASIDYNIKKKKGQNNIITYFYIKDQGYSKYYVHIVMSDLLRRTKVEEYLYVNKEGQGAKQNFLITVKNTNYPYFKTFFRKDHVFSIKHNSSVDSLFIKYSGKQIRLPYPPYSSMTREEVNVDFDSSWSVGGTGTFQFSEKNRGLYFIQTGRDSKIGLGLLNANDEFPYLKTSENLLYPLEYLTSTAEFKEMLASSNKKLSVDKFWLACGKNMNRSRELIRIYYNRTRYANVYFTSFTDGWRTDRGMIYLMFGPPKAVKKSPKKETWIYSDRLNYKFLQFVFNHAESPYTDNDYVLERNIDFRPFWSKSIKSWREGKVYTVFN